jgi:hypothetical protein
MREADAFVVSSAARIGHGRLRAYGTSLGWTDFGPDQIRDPRGVRRRGDDPFLVVNEPFGGVWLLELDGTPIARIDLPAGLEPGGGAFGAGDLYYFGSRSQRSIYQIDLGAPRYDGQVLALEGIAFPRGFTPLRDGGFIVASGTHPVTGEGRRALFHYDTAGKLDKDIFVDDPELDPLDLILHDGYVYVASEFPFGKDNAVVSLRRYDAQTGAGAGVWTADNTAVLARVRKPRGIAFGDDDTAFICAQNCIFAVDVTTFGNASIVAEDDQLAGQSLALNGAKSLNK